MRPGNPEAEGRPAPRRTARAMVDRQQFDPRGDVKAAVQALRVIMNRVAAQAQPGGNLLLGLTFRECGEDLPRPRGQAGERPSFLHHQSRARQPAGFAEGEAEERPLASLELPRSHLPIDRDRRVGARPHRVPDQADPGFDPAYRHVAAIRPAAIPTSTVPAAPSQRPDQGTLDPPGSWPPLRGPAISRPMQRPIMAVMAKQRRKGMPLPGHLIASAGRHPEGSAAGRARPGRCHGSCAWCSRPPGRRRSGPVGRPRG